MRTRETGLVVVKWILFHFLSGRDYARFLHLRSQITQFFLWFGGYERRYVAMLKNIVRPGDTVVDVGANFGAYTGELSRLVGRRGRVLAFEPSAEVFRELSARAAKWKNVDCFDVALSDRPRSVVELKLPLIFGVPEAALGSLQGRRHSAYLSQWVGSSTLDRHCRSTQSIRFIKADIEGHELPFLEGAREVCRRHRPTIQLEVGDYVSQPAFLAWLTELKYGCYRLNRRQQFEPWSVEKTRELNLYLLPHD